MTDQVRVGLVGAGPWAAAAHAPALAAGPDTALAGVWARRPKASAALAESYGVPSFADLDELLDACDAVAFSVPPDVQAELALRAVRAGKAVLLEKPLGMDLEGAQRLADVIAEANVVSQMVFTLRYSAAARDFLSRVGSLEPIGGHGTFVGSLRNGGPFATPWRLERGALLDLGPHVVDLLDAALGPVVGVRAEGDSLRWVALTLEHEGGALSQASLCAFGGGALPPPKIEVYGAQGHASVEWPSSHSDMFTRMVAEFAEAVRSGTAHPLDAQHGVRIQKILADAESQLARRTA